MHLWPVIAAWFELFSANSLMPGDKLNTKQYASKVQVSYEELNRLAVV
jgi:hypothetical protein